MLVLLFGLRTVRQFLLQLLCEFFVGARSLAGERLNAAVKSSVPQLTAAEEA